MLSNSIRKVHDRIVVTERYICIQHETPLNATMKGDTNLKSHNSKLKIKEMAKPQLPSFVFRLR